MSDPASMADALYGPAAAPSAPNVTAVTAGVAQAPAAPVAPSVPVDPAAALYGGPARQEVAKVEQVNETPQERTERQADTLFNEAPLPDLPIPDHIKTMRSEDATRKLYDPVKTFQVALPDTALAETKLTPTEQKAVVQEWRHMAADLGMTNKDLLSFKDVVTTFKEPTPEVKAEWHDKAVQELNDTYGDGAKAALRDAAKLAQRDPRMAKMLATGLGDHPTIIVQFARLARQERVAGRLK